MDMKTAVLAMNLGITDDTRTISFRRYLRDFLGDGRVVDVKAILRYILANLIIVSIRGFKSAAFYNDVWTENGSPLKYHLNELVKAKASAIINAGLTTLICVGETEEQKNNGQTEEIVCEQIKNSIPEISNAENTVIAYEPIWAIGTGKTPSLDEIKKIHECIRTLLGNIKGENASQQMRVLYGGSVKPGNAKDIFSLEDVDGALVGGASLKAAEFIEIAKYA